MGRQPRCRATNYRPRQSIYVTHLCKVGGRETSSLLSSRCRHGGRHKPAFSILDCPSKNSKISAKKCTTKLKIALRLFYYTTEYSTIRRVLKLSDCHLLIDCRRKSRPTAYTGLSVQNLRKRRRKQLYKSQNHRTPSSIYNQYSLKVEAYETD